MNIIVNVIMATICYKVIGLTKGVKLFLLKNHIKVRLIETFVSHDLVEISLT